MSLTVLAKQCVRFVQKQRRLLIIATVAVILVLAIKASYSYQQQEFINVTLDQYGQSIAHLAAEQMVTSTLHNDAISLQAIARNITNKTASSTVIIYNNSNHILAQITHKSLTPQTIIQHYTAPIVSSDNIIGSVTIGIAPNRFSNPINNTFITVVIIGIILIMLIYATNTRALANTKDKTTNKPATPSPTAKDTLALTPSTHEKAILLTIKLENTQALYQQLNADLRHQQLQQLEKHIICALNLYCGKTLITTNDSITLSFARDNADGIFNALYSGELILKLNQHSSTSMLTLNALIQAESADLLLARQLEEERKYISSGEYKNNLFIKQTLVEQYELESHVALEGNSNITRIMHLKGSYKELLDNQLAQLLKQNS